MGEEFLGAANLYSMVRSQWSVLFLIFFVWIEAVLAPLFAQAKEGSFIIHPPKINFKLDVELNIPAINLQPALNILTAPFRFLAFAKEQFDEQASDIAQKSRALFTMPFTLTRNIRELAGFLSGPPAPANPQKPLARVNPQGTLPERIVTRLVKETTVVHDVVIEHSPSLLPPPR